MHFYKQPTYIFNGLKIYLRIAIGVHKKFEVPVTSADMTAIPIAHCFHGNSLITGTVRVCDHGNLTPPHVNKPTVTHDRAPTIPPRYCNTLECAG